MNFQNGGTDYINGTIPNVNVRNMSLIILKINYGAIDSENTSCQG